MRTGILVTSMEGEEISYFDGTNGGAHPHIAIITKTNKASFLFTIEHRILISFILFIDLNSITEILLIDSDRKLKREELGLP